jgi:hypothetical protein
MVAVGETLALIDTTGDPYREGPQHSPVLLRNADGDWGRLPDPPFGGDLVRVGDTVAVTSVDCSGEDCYGQPIGTLFDRTSGKWRDLDFGGGEDGDAVVAFDQPSGRIGVVSTVGWFGIAESGDVTALPDLPDRYLENLLCQVDDVLVQVALGDQWVDEKRTIETVWTLDLETSATGWREGASPPVDARTGPFFVCGPDGPIMTTSDTETRYDAGTDSWSVAPANLPAALQVQSAHADDVTLGSDGSMVARLDEEDSLFRRDTSGQWTDLGITAVDVYAVGDELVYWTRENPTDLRVLED